MTENKIKKNKIKISKKLIFFALGLALYWVVFLWGFWTQGINALGMNAALHLVLFLGFFVYAIKNKIVKKSVNLKSVYAWLIPVFLIALSFALFENPFIKAINFFILPLILAVFISYTLVIANSEQKEWHWSLNYLAKLFFNNFHYFTKIIQAVKLMNNFLFLNLFSKKNKIRDIFFGLLIFFLIAFLVVIPLLKSVDPVFSEKMSYLTDWFFDIFSFKYVLKLIFFLIISLFMLDLLITWKSKSAFRIFSWRKFLEMKPKKQEIDQNKLNQKQETKSIIAGIVLGGIFLIYLLFIFIQINHLFLKELPVEFSETERLVKSGFWQLFFLSMINAFLFFLFYKKTSKLTQTILLFFSLGSLLLIFSAGWRMYLYIIFYGLSYEKFFASYTVIYSIILFNWLIASLFSKKRKDIFKFLVFSFLWLYAITTVLPIEKIIFNSNVALTQKEDSRINLYELKMLSADVYSDVKNYRNDQEWQDKWQIWLINQEIKSKEKNIWEKNLTDFLNQGNFSDKSVEELEEERREAWKRR
jgi:hypothetical protein